MTVKQYNKLRAKIIARHMALIRMLGYEHTQGIRTDGKVISDAICDCFEVVMELHGFYRYNLREHCRIWTDFKNDHPINIRHKAIIRGAWRKREAHSPFKRDNAGSIPAAPTKV